MPSKKELLKRAEELGIEVPEGTKKPELEDLIAEAEAEESNEEGSDEESSEEKPKGGVHKLVGKSIGGRKIVSARDVLEKDEVVAVKISDENAVGFTLSPEEVKQYVS